MRWAICNELQQNRRYTGVWISLVTYVSETMGGSGSSRLDEVGSCCESDVRLARVRNGAEERLWA